jgi:hypothetical protein
MGLIAIRTSFLATYSNGKEKGVVVALKYYQAPLYTRAILESRSTRPHHEDWPSPHRDLVNYIPSPGKKTSSKWSGRLLGANLHYLA